MDREGLFNLSLNPSPEVAVVTPYLNENLDLLRQCHLSVVQQTVPCLHVLVADGQPRNGISDWNAHHIVLPASHHDIGSTPRLIGSFHAVGLGIKAVAYLDADNWYAPNHIGSLLTAMNQECAAFASSSRMLCRLDGTLMVPCPITNPRSFIDTNCMLFGQNAFHLLHNWVLMPDYGHLIGDRIMLHHIHRAGLRHVHLNSPTVFYRCGKEGLYKHLGEAIPQGVKPRPDYEGALRSWTDDGFPPLESRDVDIIELA